MQNPEKVQNPISISVDIENFSISTKSTEEVFQTLYRKIDDIEYILSTVDGFTSLEDIGNSIESIESTVENFDMKIDDLSSDIDELKDKVKNIEIDLA